MKCFSTSVLEQRVLNRFCLGKYMFLKQMTIVPLANKGFNFNLGNASTSVPLPREGSRPQALGFTAGVARADSSTLWKYSWVSWAPLL